MTRNPIVSGGIAGCCVGHNFYNLGGAHGHPTAKDQDEFNSWLLQKATATLNIAITNSQQAKTRQYLIAAGWETRPVGKGGLHISTISSSEFSVFRQKATQRLAELKAAKDADIRKREEERQKQIQGTKFGLKLSPVVEKKPIFRGKVYRTEIVRIVGPDLSTQLARNAARLRLNEHYGINLQPWEVPTMTLLMNTDSYIYDDLRRKVYRRTAVARGIIYRGGY